MSELNKHVFFSISIDELMELIKNTVRSELVQKQNKDMQEKLLSPEETRHIFNPPISKVTLHSWAKQGRVKPHRIGGRVFYKYSELMEDIKVNKRNQRT